MDNKTDVKVITNTPEHNENGLEKRVESEAPAAKVKLAHRPRRNVPKWRQPSGPRPFDPTSAKAQISLEEHLERAMHVNDNSIKHHRKTLSTATKRIHHLQRGIAIQGTKRNKGEISREYPKNTILWDLKKQEIRILEAFQNKQFGEDSTVYLLAENLLLPKLLAGPAFYRADLETASLATTLAVAAEWMKMFREKNDAGEAEVAFSEATMAEIRGSKAWRRRANGI